MKRQPDKLERELRPNQTPAPNVFGILVLVGFAGAAAYALFAKPAKAAAGPSCPIDTAKLSKWGLSRQIAVLYLPLLDKPPPVADLPQETLLAGSFVVVTKDGLFWTYKNGVAEHAVSLHADYCSFAG